MRDLELQQLRSEVNELLQPTGDISQAAGEAASFDMSSQRVNPLELKIWDTLAEPTSIAIAASEHRMKAAEGADVLSAALDAAESVHARNSLEKMLAHQLAALHHGAMKFLGLASEPELSLRERARMANAGARLVDTFQNGLLTLRRFRTGGRQTVVVQHVQVSHGGQAVVAGNLKTRHRKREGV